MLATSERRVKGDVTAQEIGVGYDNVAVDKSCGDTATEDGDDAVEPVLDLSVDNDLLLAERQMQAMAKVLHKLICDGMYICIFVHT